MIATRTNGTRINPRVLMRGAIFQGFVPARGYLVVAIAAAALVALLKGAGL
jgi:hypothetical protein